MLEITNFEEIEKALHMGSDDSLGLVRIRLKKFNDVKEAIDKEVGQAKIEIIDKYKPILTDLRNSAESILKIKKRQEIERERGFIIQFTNRLMKEKDLKESTYDSLVRTINGHYRRLNLRLQEWKELRNKK